MSIVEDLQDSVVKVALVEQVRWVRKGFIPKKVPKQVCVWLLRAKTNMLVTIV